MSKFFPSISSAQPLLIDHYDERPDMWGGMSKVGLVSEQKETTVVSRERNYQDEQFTKR